MIKGSKHTAATRAKMSVSQRGKRGPYSAEHKAAISAGLTGRTGELNGRWVGDDVGYDAMHRRAKKVHADQPCAHADETCTRRMAAAFRHNTPEQFVRINPTNGCRYSIRIEDYMPLCTAHHGRYDAKNPRPLAR